MASLSIGIDVRGVAQGASPGMVAEIERLGGPDGRQRRTVSVSAGEPRRLDDVAPGLWEIRVVTPAGRVLTREVEVEDGIEATADFDISVRTARGDRAAYLPPSVPHEPAADPPTKGIVARGIEAFGRGTADFRGMFDGFGSPRFGGGAMGRIRVQNLPKVEADTGVEARFVPAGEARADVQVLAAWSALAEAVAAGRPPDPIWSAGRPVGASAAGTGVDDGELWSIPGELGGRTFALVDVAGGHRLHVVPVLWRQDGPDTGVLLSVGAEPGSGSRIVVGEPSYAGLLSYLSHGAVVTAVEMIAADDALRPYGSQGEVEMLRDKRACPLGACAAAYALVGTAVPASEAPWHPWISNLRQWFAWLPDGAILDARLRLLTARTDADVDAVLDPVREALARGVPFYRQGFDWLLQAMAQFHEDDLVAAALPLVSRVAASLDVAEVFTTFELKGGR